MTSAKFLDTIKSRIARTAVGASAVRGRGHAGTVEAARSFLRRRVDLQAFGTPDEKAFATALNRTTSTLRKTLPSGAQHWGLSRKVLNLFLLDSFYNIYLNPAFHLNLAEDFFELPLDSITGSRVWQTTEGALPRWPGVKHLTPEASALFQRAAAEEAKRQGVARVHLDAMWWSAGRDNS